MDVKNLLKQLESSEEYKGWKKDNKESYLVHIFKMFDKANVDETQIGYYDKEKHTITTFVLNERSGDVKLNPESEIFKENEKHIEALELEKVDFPLNSVMKKAESFRKEHYAQHLPEKAFLILQNIKEGNVWNFTFITKTFHVLNIKMDAMTGNVKDHKLSSIFEFKGEDIK